MKSLNEDIKSGQFKKVYLLYGDEAYLKRQYKERLTKAMVQEGDTMNYSYYEGENIPVPEVIDLAETMPFFADRRLIVIEDSGFFKSASAEMAAYIKTMPDTVCFLFIESEIDKRGKLYKAVKEKGRIVEMGRQNERTLLLWILGMIKADGKRIQESTARYFISKIGPDMENLSQELEKLLCYVMGEQDITMEDVDSICTSNTENKIFEMIDAVAAKKQKTALGYYYDLLSLKEPPMRILYMLARQFKILFEVKDLVKRGYSKKQIQEEKGLHPFVVSKCMDQCRAFSTKDLRRILEEAAELETSVKTGLLNDVMSVELFIVKNSMA